MGIEINIGGDTRTADEKLASRLRRQLIERGVITPTVTTPGERPPMRAEVVTAYRNRLIRDGFLVLRKP